MGLYHNFLEELNRVGVSGILALQQSLPECDNIFHAITEVANSAHTFTLLIPLAAALDLQLACDLLVVTVVGEWCNTLLKWTLMEGRPFWWVRETDVYKQHGLIRPVLQQTSHTCETGAGSPSGHVMHIAVICFVIVKWLITTYESRSKFPRPGAIRFQRLLWSCYGLILILVSLSRMYIAAHFPHQCVLGAAYGVPLAWCLTSKHSPICQWWKAAGRCKLFGVAMCMSVMAFGGYWMQKALGVDPQWSVRLAFKWCQSHQNLHVSTTNVFSLVRDCGSAFGFALACPYSCRLVNKRLSVPPGILVALLLNVAVRTAQKSIPTSNVFTFFSAHFLLHAVLPPLVLLAFPSPGSDQPQNGATSSSNVAHVSRRSRAKHE